MDCSLVATMPCAFRLSTTSSGAAPVRLAAESGASTKVCSIGCCNCGPVMIPQEAKDAAMTDRVDAARERMGRAIFETWDAHDIGELVRLMRKFADAITEEPPAGS